MSGSRQLGTAIDAAPLVPVVLVPITEIVDAGGVGPARRRTLLT